MKFLRSIEKLECIAKKKTNKKEKEKKLTMIDIIVYR